MNTERVPKNNPWLALIGLVLIGFILSLDFSIINTALPNIQIELHATLGQLQWMINIFNLFLVCFMVTMGRIGDMIGNRTILYLGIVLFAVASLFAGLSQTPSMLIIFRALQGFATAMSFPSTLALIKDIFPKKSQPLAVSIWSSLVSVGLSLGPVISGFIISTMSWRWIFFVNIPVAIAAYWVCFATLGLRIKRNPNIHIDWWGFILTSSGIALLIVSIIQSPIWGITSILTLACFAAACILLLTLYFYERNHHSPLIDFSLFSNTSFKIGSLGTISAGLFLYSVLFLIPLYLQNIHNDAPYIVGLQLLALTSMITLFSPICSHITKKIGVTPLITTSMIVLIVCSLLLSTFSSTTQTTDIILVFLLSGASFGLLYSASTEIALSSLTSANAGSGASLFITTRNLAGGLGLACVGTIFRQISRASFANQTLKNQIHFTSHQQHIISNLLMKPSRATHDFHLLGSTLGQKVKPMFINAFVHSFSVGMLSVAAVIMVLLILVISSWASKKFALGKRQGNV